MTDTWEEHLKNLRYALHATDGCGAKRLADAKDSLIAISYHINSLRPTHDCASCLHFRLLDCELVPGKMPPEHVLKNGCEMWQDAFDIPF